MNVFHTGMYAALDTVFGVYEDVPCEVEIIGGKVRMTGASINELTLNRTQLELMLGDKEIARMDGLLTKRWPEEAALRARRARDYERQSRADDRAWVA